MLSEELERLESHLRALNRPVVDLLIPRIDETAVRKALGDDIPVSVTAWFAWCNGVACTREQPQDEISLVPGRWPLSVTEARSIIDDYSEILSLPGSWIPLLEDGGGDVYAAMWRAGEDDARIVDVRLDDSTDVVFPSISDMVAYFNSCFEHGAYFVEDDGRLSLDPFQCADLYPPTS